MNRTSPENYTRKEFFSAAWRGLRAFLPAVPLVSGFCRGEEFSRSSSAMIGNNQTVVVAHGPGYHPPYLELQAGGELKRRGEELWEKMEACCLCPRECGTNRLAGERGDCGATDRIEVNSYHPHYGEERPLSGRKGSGTIFLSNCSLRCVFCINWQVSHSGVGTFESPESVAKMMLDLQEQGCHNINLVTPTHYSPHILLALDIAASRGLRLPLVYNTCGWEKVEILKYLDGVVDIYLPDFKYSDPKMAARYSDGASSYPEVAKKALLEMQKQVGTARVEPDGLIYRGLMIRHLVMPNNVSGSREVFQWVAENLPKETYLNIMSQYHPFYKASLYPEINRKLDRREYRQAIKWAEELGLSSLDIQGY